MSDEPRCPYPNCRTQPSVYLTRYGIAILFMCEPHRDEVAADIASWRLRSDLDTLPTLERIS